MKNLKISKIQLAKLKKHIDLVLEERCINVETKLSTSKRDNGEIEFQLTSTKFTTVPMLHRNLRIENWSNSIQQDEDNKNILNIYIGIHVSYDGNGINLFGVSARIRKDDAEWIGIKNERTSNDN